MADKPVRWRRRVIVALVLLVIVGLVARSWFGGKGIPDHGWVLLDSEGGDKEARHARRRPGRRSWFGGKGIPDQSWVLLDLEGGYNEDVPADSLSRVFGEHPMSLFDLLLVIRDAGEDPRVAGMVVRVRPLTIGEAHAADIRNALLG